MDTRFQKLCRTINSVSVWVIVPEKKNHLCHFVTIEKVQYKSPRLTRSRATIKSFTRCVAGGVWRVCGNVFKAHTIRGKERGRVSTMYCYYFRFETNPRRAIFLLTMKKSSTLDYAIPLTTRPWNIYKTKHISRLVVIIENISFCSRIFVTALATYTKNHFTYYTVTTYTIMLTFWHHWLEW